MKSRVRPGASTLLLLELVLCILIFSVASAMCAQIFVRSHNLSREAKELNMAVSAVSTAAEAVSAAESPEELESILREVYPNIAGGEAKLQNGELTLKVVTAMENGMLSAEISVFDAKGDPVHSQTVLHYVQGGC